MLVANRLGHVFDASQGPDWMVSHGTYCTPMRLDAETIRVFLVARDERQRGLVGYVDVSARDPRKIVGISPEPVLRAGEPGAFDDRGIATGSLCHVGDALWLYYMGWNKPEDLPFRNSIGLAISKDGRGDRFERAFKGPLVDRSRFNPYTISYPFVEPGDGTKPWVMLYGSHRGTGGLDQDMDHALTDATSTDGIDWKPSGRVVLELKPGEYGVSRPWIVTFAGKRFLLISLRRAMYKIGAAIETEAGFERITDDLLGPSDEAWEREATCYPATITVDGVTYLFYSGNNYGRTGFGLATLDYRGA